MRQIYIKCLSVFLVASMLVGGLLVVPSCSSYTEDMLGSFPFLEAPITDTVVSGVSHHVEIPVTTNCEWRVVVDDYNGGGLWVEAEASDDYKMLTLSNDANYSDDDRYAIITIVGTNGVKFKTFTLNQRHISSMTYDGLLVFLEQHALDENKYTYVNGAVFVGSLLNIENISKSEKSDDVVIVDIEGVSFTVGRSDISDISGLSRINDISERSLYIINNEIREIPTDYINNLQLESLYLDHNYIYSLAGFSDLTTLRNLSIANNDVSNISELSALQNISKLNISNNEIEDISALADMKQITHLILGESYTETNNIRDLSVLNELPLLEFVSLSGLPIDAVQIENLNLPYGCVVVAEYLKGSGMPVVTTHDPIVSGNGFLLSGTFVQGEQNVGIESYGFYYGTTDVVSEMTYIEATWDGYNFTAELSYVEGNVDHYTYAVVTTSEGNAFGGLKVFGGSSFNGNIILRTQAEVDNFASMGYSSIDGNLIVGTASSEWFESYGSHLYIDDVLYYFGKTDIYNIDALANLTNVTGGIYILYTDGLINLSVLSPLTSLSKLYLSYNQITDLSPLSSLTNLDELSIWGNEVSDLSPISQLTNLTYLNFSYNQVSDLSPLSQLKNLRYLNYGGNKVNDLSPLSQLTTLTTLHIDGNEISDLSPLSQLINLNTLDISSNYVNNLSPLSSLTNLYNLYFNNNQVTDLSPLSSLTNLGNSYFRYNQIGDISPLSQLTNLHSLNFDGNQVSDISPLMQLTNLTYLHFNSNQVSDISVLENHTKLDNLGLSYNLVDNVVPLQNLSSLRYLYLDGLPLTQYQVDELQGRLPNCNIYANDLTGVDGDPTSISVEVSIGGFTVADRNVGSQQGGVAYNYTNATSHPDHNNSAFQGGYYTWEEALTACDSGGGWRLPSKEEQEVISSAMQFSNDRGYLEDGDGNRCYFPLSGYSNNPSGVYGYYWSSTEYDNNYYHAWALDVSTNNSNVFGSWYSKSDGLSVRCVK